MASNGAYIGWNDDDDNGFCMCVTHKTIIMDDFVQFDSKEAMYVFLLLYL